MYLMPFLAAISPWKLQRTAKLFFLGLFGVTVALIIGLRHEIGNDWFHYLDYYKSFVYGGNIAEMKIAQPGVMVGYISGLELGYSFINLVSSQMNFGIYGVNLFCGIIFIYGLIIFCKSQPYPWISLGIAMPFLGIVFAMGATRQAAALGLFFIAIVSLINGSRIKYIVWICIAMTFHRSAVILMPFCLTVGGHINKRQLLLIVVLILIAIWSVSEKLLFYIQYFVIDEEHVETLLYAHGGRARVWLNVLPVLLYLLLSKNKLLFKEQGGGFWKYLSIATIISIISVEFFSAATDRVNMYFAAIQIMFWPRIISMQHSKLNKAFVAFGIFVLYSMVLFVWFNFARHRGVYIPYQNIMLLGM